MAEYVYTMSRVSKIVPPKRQILKDISLSFFPGAKIGVLGLNGAGKSTLLRIMAGIDTDIDGEARPQPGLNVGYLPQEPVLDESKTVREIVEEAVADVAGAMKRLDEVYAAYAEPDADFDALAKEQGELESLRRYKEVVEEVRAGMECGLAVKGYKDIKVKDKIEVYDVQLIKRSL